MESRRLTRAQRKKLEEEGAGTKQEEVKEPEEEEVDKLVNQKEEEEEEEKEQVEEKESEEEDSSEDEQDEDDLEAAEEEDGDDNQDDNDEELKLSEELQAKVTKSLEEEAESETDEKENDERDTAKVEQQEESEEEEDEGEGSFFASTLQSLVSEATSQQDTVLTKRKTRELKELSKVKKDIEKLKENRKEKRRRKEQGMVNPEESDIVMEKQLRRIATRGVVTLFNAIQTHQGKERKKKEQELKAGKLVDSKTVKEVSKESFLELLKENGQASKRQEQEVESEKADQVGKEATNKKKGSGWDALREDYMLGAKMGDFDSVNVEMEEEDDIDEQGFNLEEED